MAAWIHADIVYLFVGLIIAMALALHLVNGPATARRREWQLIALVVANGVLGYLQLFLGLPLGSRRRTHAAGDAGLDPRRSDSASHCAPGERPG